MAVSTPSMFLADVALPPTFVFDSLYLGWPIGPIVGVFLAGSAIAGFFCLRKVGLHALLAVVLAVLYFAAVNFAIYVVAQESNSRNRREIRQQFFRDQKARDSLPDPGLPDP